MILFPVLLSAETWTQKAVLPGGVRDGAVGFSIGNKGYVGTGYHSGLFYWYAYQDFLGMGSWYQCVDTEG